MPISMEVVRPVTSRGGAGDRVRYPMKPGMILWWRYGDLPDARHTPGWLMLPAPDGHDERDRDPGPASAPAARLIESTNQRSAQNVKDHVAGVSRRRCCRVAGCPRAVWRVMVLIAAQP